MSDETHGTSRLAPPKLKRETRYPDIGGRDIHEARYRPKRHRVSDFLGARAVSVTIGEQSYSARDISMNGIAVDIQPGQPMWPDGSEMEITVRLYDETVLTGPAKVVRVDSHRRGHRMALGLLDDFLDLPALSRSYQEHRLSEAFQQTPTDRWEALPPAYREAVSHADYFMRRYERILGQHEARYREMGRDGTLRIDELAQRACDEIRGPWNQIRAQAAEASLPLMDPAAKKLRFVAKEYTETVLTPLLLAGPVVHRSYTKPLDYAGDFKTMGHIYRNALEGDSIFGRVVHKLAVEEPLAAGVRTRKDLIKRLHHEEAQRIRTLPQSEPFRVTSLGSGLALEVSELVRERPDWGRRTHWTMVDIEENALSLAYADVHTAIRECDAPVDLRCYHTNFEKFLAAPLGATVDKPQHFIYASGLFDYIQLPQGQQVIRSLYERLAPNGLLSIGNALWPNKHFWFGEFVLAWSLLYRTEAQMRELTGLLGDDATFEIEAEPSEAYYFLNIRKNA